MTDTLKPYPKYRKMDISGIDEIPLHWSILPGRACFEEKKNSNKGMIETQVLSLSYGRIIKKAADKLHGLVPESFETYQIVEPGDIIFRPTDLQNDHTSLRFGLSNYCGIITSAYLCLNPTFYLNNTYAHLLLHTYDLNKIFYGLGSGLRQNIDWRDFKYLPCFVPPLDEQQAIVRHLDYVDGRIRRYIRAKQKQIKLLEEQKQAIIQQAVTRGLDPHVRLKPSGVEWLGDVPEHWIKKPLKRWVLINHEILSEDINANYKFRYIDIGTVKTGYLCHNPIDLKFQNAPSRARRVVHFGDTIISTVRTYLKAIWFVNEDAKDLVVSTGFTVLTPTIEVEPEYISYVLQSVKFVDKVTAYSTGTTYPAIDETTIGNFFIYLPPNKKEQSQILYYLRSRIDQLGSIILKYQNEISLLKEYRTRLISDVVTGKLDVRAAAASLPFEETEIEAEVKEENDVYIDDDAPADTVEYAEEGEE